jgi:hypothetical protein
LDVAVESTDTPEADWNPSLGWTNIYKISNMKWVRGAGFDESWESIGSRDGQ